MKHSTLLLILFAAILASCHKKEDLGNVDNIPGLGGDSTVATAIDDWITDSLTNPFNVAVKYRWDQSELELNKTLVPPDEDKIIPVLGDIKKVWLNNYVAEAGDLFMKKYAPKFLVLVGSPDFNPDGTITLGTAEGGHEIVIYDLNDYLTKNMTGYVPSDSVNVKMMFHTIEHEFAHILHQTILYPTAFKDISVGSYTSNWNNVSDAGAHNEGFVTAYAMSAPDEDFVEMVSTMLVEGRAGFDNIVNGITGTGANGLTADEAKSALRQKESIVVSYFKDAWNIDFYSLQTRVRASVVSLIQ